MSQFQSTKITQEAPVLYDCKRDENLMPGIRFGPIVRDIYIFECCTAGYGSVIINGKEFFFGPGDAYVLLPGDTVVHTADKLDPREGIWCGAGGSVIGNVLKQIGITSTQPFLPKSLFQDLNELLEKMILTIQSSDPGIEMFRTSYLYRLLGILMRQARSSDSDAITQRIIGIMEARYFEPLTMKELADAVGLERSYFSTFFKTKTGIPPHRYLTRLRIRKACTLMDQTQASIADAAESVGLDPANFARLFKRETGMTPLQYKHK